MTNVLPDKQRELALHVLKRLREAGHQALWAGGCVRDQLLARTPNDYDVATDATPAAIRTIFGRRRTLEIGAAFGVVAVLGSKDAGSVEVSTFRRDVQYSDGRHPDAVVFSTPEEDAQRRDFTINGLFYDPLENRVIDYVDGQADLERRIVRAIGDPRHRFSEDKLRMIRAVRMASTFQFQLDEPTAAAIDEMADTINVVSPERIAQELRKILVDRHRAQAVELLQRTRLLSMILPELSAIAGSLAGMSAAPAVAAEPDAWHLTLRVLDALREPSFSLALAALLHAVPESANGHDATDSAKRSDHTPGIALAVGERLRLANKEQNLAQWLIDHYRDLTDVEAKLWSCVQPLLIARGAAELVDLNEAHGRAVGGEAAERARQDAEFCRQKLALPAGELDPTPLLGGHDLAHLGIPKGAIYRQLLERVRAAQLDGEVRTPDEAVALVRRLVDAGDNDK